MIVIAAAFCLMLGLLAAAACLLEGALRLLPWGLAAAAARALRRRPAPVDGLRTVALR